MEAITDVAMSTEFAVVFKTNLPEEFRVEETEIQLATSSTSKDLTQVLLQLYNDSSVVEKRKFNFMVNNTFLTSTLGELLTRLSFSNESTVEVWYLFALEKPKPKHTSPQDEWVSVICPLRHYMNEKAKSYVVGLMNGDVKLYDHKHAELLKVTSMHDSVSSLLYFKSDNMGCNYLVSGSEAPGAALVFS